MRLACAILLAALGLAWPAAGMERGELLFHLGGCQSCHSREGAPPLAGGAPLVTPLGTFHPPNITPDPATGIGNWSEDDFLRAMAEGIAPDGSPYYPSFPFASYARMTRDDLRALWAYLRNEVAPTERPSPPHELMFPFSVRTGLWAWRWLFFDPVPIEPDPARDAAWNEGAYLVRGPGHCAECHSPRTFWGFGVPDPGQELAGNPGDLITGRAPAITPDPEHGIGKWSPGDLDMFLSLGMTPEGDFVGGEMAKVVENATGPIPEQTRAAIVSFLLTPR
ncbi:cytochrome c [Geminicoccus flavidas]|uniref:cytochrome c n=1 Tax=Geminicoccus flavidas TaxID=2506407 RepID=UPI00135A5467|nr:cytochrome c [Geminicoccus flavidas]